MINIKGSGGGGCFPAGVKVLTPSGETPIELLKIGDEVLSFDYRGTVEISIVEEVFVHEALPTILVNYWGGSLRTTSNHWVLNQYNTFAEIGTLTSLDAIVDQLGHLRPIISMVDAGTEPVYNLHVSKNHTFIADGIRVHNGGLGLKTPVVGSGGGGGSKGSGGRASIESPDSLRSQQFANVVDLISEGEIVGLELGAQDIFLDNTPLQNSDLSYNFTGFGYQTRNGTQAQTYIEGFSQIESEKSVGVEISYGVPVVRQVTNSDIDAVVVTIAVPVLSYTDTSTGDVSGTSVEIKIELQSNGGGYVTVPLNGYEIISGKASTRYQRSYNIPLSGSSPWDIRVSRITADSTTQYLQNKTWWDTYTEVIDTKLTYPNSAIVAISIDSSQFNNIPARGYRAKGIKIKIPDNYDPVTRIYTGVWLGTFKVAWSDNPAWVFYDLVTNTRYGLGGFVSDALLDVGTLYQIAQYCDELVPDGYGGQEPRYTCNLYLQSREEAFHVLSSIAGIFAGMIYWSNGFITASIDKPSDSVYHFTNANVIDGIFEYSGSSQTSRHTVALVTWNDPNDRYVQKVEYVEDRDGIAALGVRETEVIAIGCTSRGQAHRFGKRILLTERYLTEVVTFRTGLEASRCYPGAIIPIQDNNRAGGRFGGRIVSATINTVTLDSSISIDSGVTYTISVALPDATIQSRQVTNIVGVHSVITVASDFSSIPEAQSIWVISSTTLDTQLFKVVSIKETDTATWEISALQYNPSKYAAIDADMQFEPLSTSLLPSTGIISAPTNLVITEELYRSNINNIDTKLFVSFDAVNNPYLANYGGAWRYANGNWNLFSDTTTTGFEIYPVLDGQSIEVSIYAVSNVGVKSATTTKTHLVIGKTKPPQDVTGFTATKVSTGVKLSWNAVPDIDIDYYVIYDEVFAEVGKTYNTYYDLTYQLYGTRTWYVTAVDTSGNNSVNKASTSIVIASPSAPILSYAFSGSNVVINWDAPATSQTVDRYKIRVGGTTWGTASDYAETYSTTISIKAAWSGARNFWVAAIDMAGNMGTASLVNPTVVVPSAPNITSQIIDNNVLLFWTDSTRTLPINDYEIRRGSTFSSAAVIGTKQGLFTTLFETVAGTYTYWVVGRDSAGNYGTEASMTATVNQPPDYVLKADYDSSFSGTLSNAVLNGGEITLPVNTTETFQAHFTTNAWTTPQDQITAGFPIYIQPSLASGYYEEEIDYGSVLASSKVTVTATTSIVSGSPTYATTISAKLNIGDAWTDYALSEVYLTNFRYLKIRITVTSVSTTGLMKLTKLNTRLDSKLKTVTGSQSVVSTDSGGTIVYLTDDKTSGGVKVFVDVDAIVLTPRATSASVAIFDFTDVPNPLSFKILLFDMAGTRINGTVDYSVRGF